MTAALFSSLLPVLFPALATIATSALVTLTVKAVAALSAHQKTQALAAVASAFSDALQAALAAAGQAGGKPTPQIAALAWQAAEAHLKASWPTIEKSLGAELSVVLGSHAALAAGQPVTAPGGATVTAPSPAPIALKILFLGVLLAAGSARAQATACPAGQHVELAAVCKPGSGVINVSAGGGDGVPATGTATMPPKYTLSPLGSALRFPWAGESPVEVAPGAGVQLAYNIPVNVTLPLLGTVPLFSLGGALVGSVAPSPASTSYQLSLGPILTVIHSLGIGLLVDLVAGGPDGLTGLLPGRPGLQNLAGLLVYSVQLGAAAELNLAPSN